MQQRIKLRDSPKQLLDIQYNMFAIYIHELTKLRIAFSFFLIHAVIMFKDLLQGK
jgi:hypothetical protein